MAEWQATVRRNVLQGRQLLRKLLVGRVVFTPVAEGVHFEADCTLVVFSTVWLALLEK